MCVLYTIGAVVVVVVGERVSVIGWRFRHEHGLILAVDQRRSGGGRRGSLELLIECLVDPLLPIELGPDSDSDLRPRTSDPSLPIHLSPHPSFLSDQPLSLSLSYLSLCSALKTASFRLISHIGKSETLGFVKIRGFCIYRIRDKEREKEMDFFFFCDDQRGVSAGKREK